MSKDYTTKAKELLSQKYSPNEYVKGSSEVLEYLVNRGYGGVASYSALSDDLEVIKLTNTACIADIMCGRMGGKTPSYVVYYLHRNISEVGQRYLEWLTQESVLSKLYSFTEHFNVNGGSQGEKSLCISTDLPYNLMSLALNILRLPYENRDHLETWCKLVDIGVDKSLAFCLCTYYTVSGGVVVYNRCDRFCHSALSSPYYRGVMKFFSGAVCPNEVFDVEPYKVAQKYDGILKDLSRFGEGRDNTIGEIANIQTTIPAVVDLMGAEVTPEKKVNGITPEDLNKYWEDNYQFGVHDE